MHIIHRSSRAIFRTQMRNASTQAKAISTTFGTEVTGVDLAKIISDPKALSEIVSLVYQRGLVVFRDQDHLTPHEELAFAHCFNHQLESMGATSYTGGASPQAKLPPPLQDIAVIGTFDLKDYHGFTGSSPGVYPSWPEGQLAWHTDGLADTDPPPDLTTMRCIVTPARGGETLFRCARQAAKRLGSRLDVGGSIGVIDPLLVRIRCAILCSSCQLTQTRGEVMLALPTCCSSTARIPSRYKLHQEYRLRPSGYSLAWASGTREGDREARASPRTSAQLRR